MHTPQSKPRGFSLIEMTVTIAIFSIVLASITGIYTAGQRYYRASSTQNELWQNVRVVFDRITREVRQSESMATTVTTEQSGAVSTIMFQDGHDTSDVRYIRYRLDGTSIWRDTLVYAFSTTPSTYVSWDALDEFDNPPEETILDEQQVGEYFSDIDFWGENNLIHMEATLEKIDYSIEVMTAVYGRNL